MAALRLAMPPTVTREAGQLKELLDAEVFNPQSGEHLALAETFFKRCTSA